MDGSEAVEVVVYGTVCLDRFVFVDEAGNAGGDDGQEMAGGEAFNTATALAGWGVRVALTGTAIGEDDEGRRLRAHLRGPQGAGIDLRALVFAPSAVTPCCTVRVFPGGERKMSGKGFRDASAPPLPLLEPLLFSRPLFLFDPNLGAAGVAACLRAAEMGCPVIAMDCAHLPEVVERAKILVTSHEWLRGEPSADAATRLRAGGAQTVILTEGANGGLVSDRDGGVFRYPSLPVPDAVDTTGAGDTFRAGLCYGLLRGLALPSLLAFASAAAGLHCRVRGGGSRPPLEAVEAAARTLRL